MHANSEITIPVGGQVIKGNLNIPVDAEMLVIFSHGSGSSRFSVRNKFVAESLNEVGIGTLLIDLLTEEEDQTYANRFDIDLLTDRLIEATVYVSNLSGLENFSIGYFGASTGAACALRAAACLPERIHAVVSRGGRPDLAAGTLPKVKAPTLLIVGSLDTDVITLNRRALTMLSCKKQIEIVPGAGHLFEEGGKLLIVADLAKDWFTHYLQHTPSPANHKLNTTLS